jgi:hypothetical protein
MISNIDSSLPADAPWDGRKIELDAIGGAVVVCSVDGVLEALTPAARTLLTSYGVTRSVPPVSIVATPFWRELVSRLRTRATMRTWVVRGTTSARRTSCS